MRKTNKRLTLDDFFNSTTLDIGEVRDANGVVLEVPDGIVPGATRTMLRVLDYVKKQKNSTRLFSDVIETYINKAEEASLVTEDDMFSSPEAKKDVVDAAFKEELLKNPATRGLADELAEQEATDGTLFQKGVDGARRLGKGAAAIIAKATRGWLNGADVKVVSKAEMDKMLTEKRGLNSGAKRFQKTRKKTAEEAKIEREAKANGTWLKAPNGEKSNLSPRRWVQVRTKAFKKWFGDWEKNPAGASKVVDANGEPLVVYHGTDYSGFAEFEDGRGTGVFFGDKERASTYSSGTTSEKIDFEAFEQQGRSKRGLYACFLNIKKIDEVDFGGKLYYKGDLSGTAYGDFHVADDVAESAKEKGFDGVFFKNIRDDGNTRKDKEMQVGDQWVVFDNKNIKSATDNVGTFDGGNADIRYLNGGERGEVYGFFNPETGEIVVREDARIDTVLHELGWHASYAWAKQNNPELYAKMTEYAQNAPQEVKDAIARDYPELEAGSETWVDEVGAALFSAEHSGKIEELLQTKEARGWWEQFKEVFKDLWKAFLRGIGLNRVDLEKLSKLDYNDAIAQMAQDFAEGKRLGDLSLRRDSEALYQKTNDFSPTQTRKEVVEARVRESTTKRANPDLEKAETYEAYLRNAMIPVAAKMIQRGEKVFDTEKAEAFAQKMNPYATTAEVQQIVELAQAVARDIAAYRKGEAHLSTKEAIKLVRTNGNYDKVFKNTLRRIRRWENFSFDAEAVARAELYLKRRKEMQERR